VITQISCTVFQQNLLNGNENFSLTSPYTYKIALYNGLANLGQNTTTYTTTNEVVGIGYTAGGKALTISTPPTQNNQYNITYVSFNNVTWNPAAFTARGALVYNATTGAACFVLNFGSDKICSTSFTIQFPAATYSSAILTIGTTTSSINYSSPS
jgi:hypothetical protein